MVYSKEELIEELQRVSKDHCDGKPPREKDMRKYGDISTYPYYDRFGSWGDTIETAGFDSEKSGNQPKYTKTEIIEEVKRVSEEHCEGKSPKAQDMRNYGSISISSCLTVFASWNSVLDEAGLAVNVKKDVSQKKLLDEINRISELYFDSNRPKKKAMKEKGRFSASVYDERFGGWENAVEKAGFKRKPEQWYKHSKEEILEEIRRVYKKLGRKPSRSEFYENSDIRISFENRFDSWNQALEKAGFTRNGFGHNALSGKGHPKWNGGDDGFYGESYNRRKWETRKRDESTCRVCSCDDSDSGRLGKIDVHHITPRTFWKEDEHEKMNHPRNLICLCRSCHFKLEGKFKGRNHEEFEELAKDYLDIEIDNESNDGMDREKGIFEY